MKKNGFTLIELIGVVLIIALVMIVSIPQIMSTFTTSTVEKVDVFRHDIESLASAYVESNWSTFKVEYTTNKNSSTGEYCLPVQILIDNKFLSVSEIDPSTEKTIEPNGKYILLKNESTNGGYKFSFTYVDINEDTSSICNS